MGGWVWVRPPIAQVVGHAHSIVQLRNGRGWVEVFLLLLLLTFWENSAWTKHFHTEEYLAIFSGILMQHRWKIARIFSPDSGSDTKFHYLQYEGKYISLRITWSQAANGLSLFSGFWFVCLCTLQYIGTGSTVCTYIVQEPPTLYLVYCTNTLFIIFGFSRIFPVVVCVWRKWEWFEPLINGYFSWYDERALARLTIIMIA